MPFFSELLLGLDAGTIRGRSADRVSSQARHSRQVTVTVSISEMLQHWEGSFLPYQGMRSTKAAERTTSPLYASPGPDA